MKINSIKNHRNLSLLTILIILVLISFFNPTVYADQTYSIPVEKYVDSPYLINEDGTVDTATTIQKFSEYVENIDYGNEIIGLPKVIPPQFLNTYGDIVEYACGKDHAFYMVKSNGILDLLLIDFIAEPAESDVEVNEYSLRIKPILQASFQKGNDSNGNTIWKKYDSPYKYYVANPTFSTMLYNENALNFGDDGYNKINDDGLIIQQTRVNFGVVEYKTKDDLGEQIWKAASEMIVNGLLDTAFSVADYYTAGIASDN